MTGVLFIFAIPAVTGLALAGFFFLVFFVGLCENIVEHLTTKNTDWDLLNRVFLTACICGTIGAVFSGIILLLS